MIDPVAELKAFVTASLATPVPRDHREPARARRRRQAVAALTLAVGTVTLGLSLRITPGNREFYGATGLLAAVWTGGAFLSGRLHVGWAATRARGLARPIVQPVVLGLLLLGVFAAGGLLIAQVPVLRDPVIRLLDHAQRGWVPLVVLLTAANGIAEELFFRGALYAALTCRGPVLATAALYAAVTAVSGVPLLAFAALVLGLVTGLQRRVTGGVLAPIITHLIWSTGMLLILPFLLSKTTR